MAELQTTLLALVALEAGFVVWLVTRRRPKGSARMIDDARRLGMRARRG